MVAEPSLRQGSLGAWLFAFVAVSHSATLSNVFYELGRFDHIGLLIGLGCLTVLARGTPGLRLGVVPTACMVGLLVHEAFALMFLPLIFAAWEYEEGRHWRGGRVICLAGLVALTWVIGTFGRMAILPMEEYLRHLDARHPFPIVEGSVLVLYSDLRQSAGREPRRRPTGGGQSISAVRGALVPHVRAFLRACRLARALTLGPLRAKVRRTPGAPSPSV
jgi:hypothetical protein